MKCCLSTDPEKHRTSNASHKQHEELPCCTFQEVWLGGCERKIPSKPEKVAVNRVQPSELEEKGHIG
jgi:hypothetical protein